MWSSLIPLFDVIQDIQDPRSNYCGNVLIVTLVWNNRGKINPKSCPLRLLYCDHTLKWVATEGNGVHHTAVKLQLFQIILAWWLTTARLNSQVSLFYPIFVVLFCKLKHKTQIFRTRNNSVSQLCRVAEDWSVLCLLAWAQCGRGRLRDLPARGDVSHREREAASNNQSERASTRLGPIRDRAAQPGFLQPILPGSDASHLRLQT